MARSSKTYREKKVRSSKKYRERGKLRGQLRNIIKKMPCQIRSMLIYFIDCNERELKYKTPQPTANDPLTLEEVGSEDDLKKLR